jgi:RHS repeat-associated protein
MNECNQYAECAPFPFGEGLGMVLWSYTLSGKPALFADRGYTGTCSVRSCFWECSEPKTDGRTNPDECNDIGKHLTEFGLINMNGRLYDPLVGRFLSHDNYVQAPYFTQSFNRYGYCWNNPLRYTDPSGDWFLSLIFPPAAPWLIYVDVFLWSATIDWAAQTISNYASNPDGKFSDWAWNDVDWLDVGVSGTAGALTMGLDKFFKAGKITKTAFKVGKALNIFAVPAVSSAFDLTPSEGFEVNNSSEFWNSYILDVAVTGISAKTGNEIVDGLLSDKPWILNDPLKGGLAKKFLEFPLLIGSEYLENRSLQNERPYPNKNPSIPEFRPILPGNIYYSFPNMQSSFGDISNNLIINRF